MKALLYSASGQVLASEATVEDYRALVIDCFGALAGIRPSGYKGSQQGYVNECGNAIFALVGQGPLERRFGITMTPKAQETVSGDS